jgi:putative copper resistance protein D
VLAVAALPQVLTVPRASRVEAVRGLLRAFSPLALRCAAILAVTGAIGGWLQLRDPGLILGSDYGLVLFRKVVVVLMIAVLGAYHWRVAQPSVGSDRSIGWLRASIVLDVAVVVVVLVLTAILTGTAPPAH